MIFRKFKHTLAFVLTLILLCSAAGFSDEKPDFIRQKDRIPDIEHFMKIGYASSPFISPDGRTVYFSNSFITPLQLFKIEKGCNYPVLLTYLKGVVKYPSLSPDGRWIVFLSDNKGDEQYQLYILDTKTGWFEPLTKDSKVRYGSAVWSPDSRTIYFRANRENPRDFNVYRMDLATRKIKLLVGGKGYKGPSGLSMNGKYLVYYTYSSNINNDLYLLDLEDGGKVHLTPHKGSAMFYLVTIAPDNETCYVISNDNKKGALKLGKLNIYRRKLRYIYDTGSPWEVENAAVNPQRTVMGIVINREGYGDFHILNIEDMSELPAPDLKGVVTVISLSAKSKLAYSYATPTRTTEIYTWDWKKKENSRLTRVSYLGIDTSKFVEPKLVKYKSFDGREIPAFLYLPPNWRKNAGNIPFIIHFHGGPEGQARPYFTRHFNYLLLHGFGVMTPNVRGSIGYGREYKNLDNYKKRMDSVKDGYYAAKYLIEKGYTQKGKIGIKGGSYGGFMVMALVTEYPDMWGAAYESVGIVDFENFLKNTKPYRRKLRETEYGPLSDPAFLRKISPIHKLHNVKAPLMITHGKNDPRVPVSEAYKIINALKKRGVKVTALIFEDEGHGVRKMKNRLKLYRTMVDFFNRHLKGSY